VNQEQKHSVQLRLCPSVESVSAIRGFVEVHYTRILADPDMVSRLAVAAHELLENAAKYSGRGPSTLSIGVAAQPPHEVSVSVASPVDHSHVDTLKETIAELSTASDPAAVYQRYLARAARRTEGSGLGLARICVEAGMRLRLECSDDLVCVEAVGAPEAQGGMP
jgi:hypothetical protein